MDKDSVAILERLKAEVWWPWDRRGGTESGYNLAPKSPQRSEYLDLPSYEDAYARFKIEQTGYEAAPNINRNLWLMQIGELIALNPQNPDVRQLRRLYQQPPSRENTKAREMLLEAMLR